MPHNPLQPSMSAIRSQLRRVVAFAAVLATGCALLLIGGAPAQASSTAPKVDDCYSGTGFCDGIFLKGPIGPTKVTTPDSVTAAEAIFTMKHPSAGTDVDDPVACGEWCIYNHYDWNAYAQYTGYRIVSGCGTNSDLCTVAIPRGAKNWVPMVASLNDFPTGLFLLWAPPVTATLSGTVTGTDGSPAAGVTIAATSSDAFSTTTDSTGHYSMSLEAGTYTVAASKTASENFTPASATVSIGAGGATQNFVMTDVGGLTLSSITIDPTNPQVGDAVDVDVAVRNDAKVEATNVTPGELLVENDDISLDSGPTPASIGSLAAGATGHFTYRLLAEAEGATSVQVRASGTIDGENSTTKTQTRAFTVGPDVTATLTSASPIVPSEKSFTIRLEVANSSSHAQLVTGPTTLSVSPTAGITADFERTEPVTIASGDSAQIDYALTATTSGKRTFTAAITSKDQLTGVEQHLTATVDVTVSDDPIISHIVNADGGADGTGSPLGEEKIKVFGSNLKEVTEVRLTEVAHPNSYFTIPITATSDTEADFVTADMVKYLTRNADGVYALDTDLELTRPDTTKPDGIVASNALDFSAIGPSIASIEAPISGTEVISSQRPEDVTVTGANLRDVTTAYIRDPQAGDKVFSVPATAIDDHTVTFESPIMDKYLEKSLTGAWSVDTEITLGYENAQAPEGILDSNEETATFSGPRLDSIDVTGESGSNADAAVTEEVTVTGQYLSSITGFSLALPDGKGTQEYDLTAADSAVTSRSVTFELPKMSKFLTVQSDGSYSVTAQLGLTAPDHEDASYSVSTNTWGVTFHGPQIDSISAVSTGEATASLTGDTLNITGHYLAGVEGAVLAFSASDALVSLDATAVSTTSARVQLPNLATSAAATARVSLTGATLTLAYEPEENPSLSVFSNDAALALTSAPAGGVAPGASVDATGGGFMPGEPVDVTLHSTPVHLATLTASEDGTVAGTVVIPADTPAGAHHVVLTGAWSGHVVTIALTVAAAATTSGIDATTLLAPPAAVVSTAGSPTASSSAVAASSDTNALAATGAGDVISLTIASGLCLAAGAAVCTLNGRRRRRFSTT